jgi:zinc and cadmium transporter
MNGLSSITTMPEALTAYYLLAEVREAKPYILAIAAASFIYITAADLIPMLHRQASSVAALRSRAVIKSVF